MGGMIAHSGRIVRLDVDMGEKITPPSIPDIGLALSRVPRFGGHTRRPWTVAHHVLWLDDYARTRGANDDIRLGILLHDAHEAVTGDIPTHFKTPDMRGLQRDLDRAIYGRYFPRFWHVEESVKYYDRIGLLTEADVVGPPALMYSDATDSEAIDRAKALYIANFPSVPTWQGPEYHFLSNWIKDGPGDGGHLLDREFETRVMRLL
jgi:hypothetical protein